MTVHPLMNYKSPNKAVYYYQNVAGLCWCVCTTAWRTCVSIIVSKSNNLESITYSFAVL